MKYEDIFKENKLLELTKIEKIFETDNHLYAKLGNVNPTGSIKDVTTFQMLIGYIERGLLKEGSIIVEATSGNTGISLAYFASIFHYKCIIVMPTSMSKQRRDMIAHYGAELCLVEGGMKECNEKASEIVKNNLNAFIFGQFDNKDNALAHYLHTGPEIVSKLDKVDYLFAGIGTGGTITGTGKYLKENKGTKVVGVEPLESPLISKGYAGHHLIQGIGANFIPKVLDQNILDDVIAVNGEKSIELAKTIREQEHLDIGISSGAALLGAINYLKQRNIHNKNVVIIFPDKGDRYTW